MVRKKEIKFPFAWYCFVVDLQTNKLLIHANLTLAPRGTGTGVVLRHHEDESSFSG